MVGAASSHMLTSYLSRAFIITARVKYYYKAHTSKSEVTPPVSTEALLQIISEVSGIKKIEILEIEKTVGWKPKRIKGQLLKEDGSATVFIPCERDSPSDPYGVSRCERRFAIIKEICHLIIDDAKDGIREVGDLVTAIAASSQTLLPVGSDDPQVIQEYIAELAALELLLWHEWRLVFLTDKSDLEIAQDYLIPECKISSLRALHSKIEERRDAFYDALDDTTQMTNGILARLPIGTVSW